MLTLQNPNGLSRAVVALLAGNIVFDVLLGLADVRDLAADETEYYDPARFGALDLNLAYSMSFTLYVATGIVFIIWFYRLRKNAEVWAGDLQTRKPGYAIGGWFIPIGNFWIPRAVAVEIWRASRWEPYAADGKRELTLLNGWWTCWIVATLVNWISGQMYKTAETTGDYNAASQWSLAGFVLDIAAAVLAILFVRRLTSMQHAKATGMIPAAQ
ncbi:DUF4328 domain-containing protein [Streptomyces sp. NBC_00572]|uniref:DUF4328 domain-containing protein n=1 Tax=Streptomyces sp. NBC_00572 TaxID=2903664 RepID=UPI00225244FF|nr:DUF4328 domain-containing protein [Streptomyces sp. NBC_00572]MCX4982992.1 DUF4328 domain-containing protein [Streptomyces sp. NBC_00572]